MCVYIILELWALALETHLVSTKLELTSPTTVIHSTELYFFTQLIRKHFFTFLKRNNQRVKYKQ